jgi:GTP pyrophosphokinase
MGARVNNVIVPLEYRLRNGDTVEIMTNKSHVPNKDWLRFVVTSKAKQRIRAFLKAEEHARSLATGHEILSKDLRKVKLSLKTLEKNGKLLELAQALGLKGEGDLYAEIGYGKISSSKVVARLLPEGTEVQDGPKTIETPLRRIFQRAAQVSRQRIGVKVSGMDNIMVRFARCCEPLPGDRISGFITRGRGVTVHHTDCSQVLQCDPARRVDVSWDDQIHAERRVKLTVVSQDQRGLLAAMSNAIAGSGANIVSAQIKTSELGKAVNMFELTVTNSKQLDSLKRALEMVPGVIKVERIKQLSPSEVMAQEERSEGVE